MNTSLFSKWTVALGAAILTCANAFCAPTINVLGTHAPTPGAADQYQTNFPTFAQSPPPGGGAFNYYVNADPAPGQTFTTGSNPSGYVFNSLALFDADNTGGGFGNESFTLNLYKVTNQTNASLVTSYSSQSIALPDFNWFQWTNLGAILTPNTQYAYAMYANGSGWMNLGNISGNFYSGGQVAIVPRGGGTMTFSTTAGWNASFDAGLTAITAVNVLQPTFTPYSIVLPGTTVTASAQVNGPAPYSYQWQTDGGTGGTLTNIPGATSSNLVINTTGYPVGNYRYDLVVSNSTSSATSPAATLLVQQPAGIAGVIAVKFGFTNGYATSDVPFPADNAGVSTGQLVPPSYQPLVPVGNWNDLLADVQAPQDASAKAAAIDQTWNIDHDTAGNTLSGVTLTPSGFNDGWHSGGTECPDGRLLYDFWKFNTANGQIDGFGKAFASLQFSGLTASTYDVFLYVNDNNGNYWGNAEANNVIAIGTSVDQNDGFNGASSDPCSLSSPMHTAGGFGNPVNYVKMPFVATSGGQININVVMQGGGDFGVAGVELVPSPDLTLTQDTLPTYAETVVGDQVVFTAAFSDQPAVKLQWQQVTSTATNNVSAGFVNSTNSGIVTSMLTLNNVQVSNTGSYRLEAINASNPNDYSFSSASMLEVSNAPASVSGVIVDYAGQTGANFYPTNWAVNSASDLIYNFQYGDGSPGTFVVGQGNFSQDATEGDPTILSDGFLGDSKPTMVTAGPSAGQSITYTLLTNSSAAGFDVTNIQVYGGWTDAGRREQKYQVLYATVSAPTNFISLVTADYFPSDPSGAATASRTSLIATNGVLMHNVAAIQFNFNVSPQPENGYEGYSEIVVAGQPSTMISPTLPILIQDVIPQTAADVVGSQLTVMSAFTNYTSLQWQKNGTNVAGATSSTLTLANLQVSDSGSYTLVASNSVGTVASSPCSVTVSPAPTAVGGVIVSLAAQTESSTVAPVFIPTWPSNMLTSSLLYNVAPSDSGTGDFTGSFDGNGDGASPPNVLTDGSIGQDDKQVTGSHSSFSVAGYSTAAGNFVEYALGSSTNGYTITNITVYGGWSDSGRDGQAYTISYTTVENATNFIPLTTVNYLPSNPNAAYSMSRATITSPSGFLASNVTSLYFDFTTPQNPGGENGFEGYSEIGVYGAASAPLRLAPTIGSVTRSGGQLVLSGTGGYPGGGSYTVLSTTNLAKPTQWTTNTVGTLDAGGSFSNSVPISSSAPAMFFIIRVP